jgi:6-phosphofructokinase 1
MKKLAIVAAGGPAPGLNSVIGAIVIRACLSNVPVIGIQDGFKWLAEGDTSHAVPLGIADVSRIHFRGGSVIGISRASATKSPQAFESLLRGLLRLEVGMLAVIGGDGSATLAAKIHERARDWMRVVHVPKTIDNDIDLPADVETFGFPTARHIGVEIVKNLMVDAKTTSRWYLVVAQGRKAGHLALAIGKAAGATVSIIPEEFPKGRTRLATIVDTIAGAILKRLALGRPDGVAILAEGLADCVDPEELAKHCEVPRDAFGNVHVAKINLGDLLRGLVEKRLEALGVSATIMAKAIGYEVRCADPIPDDMEYCRDLGYCAARYIIEGGTGAMVCIQAGSFRAIPFGDLLDPVTARMRVRMVDVESDRYKIARTYMIRLRREDFDSPLDLARLAGATRLTPEQFRAEFAHVVDHEPSPMRRLGPPPTERGMGVGAESGVFPAFGPRVGGNP